MGVELETTLPSGDHWFAEPLLAAGLDADDIAVLVSRLTHVAMGCGPEIDTALRGLVADQPEHVRAAWIEMIDRMIQWSGRLP
jgi:hypothetical protein